MKQNVIRILILISRILFGVTFMFSGFVKAVDPMGSAYKFMDYFRAFDLGVFNDLAVPLAVFLAALEFTVGVSILFGSYRRLSTWGGLLFMAFFTPLTLYLAIANPVSDCGCFGDALILTNWETFWKNVVLLSMAVLLFIKKDQIRPIFIAPLRWIPAFYALFFAIGISFIGLNYLPIIDFRPYKVGVNIKEAMLPPEGAPETQYILVYEKEGKQQEFSLDNYPDDDSWTFVETRTLEPDEKWQPQIKDFVLTNEEGDNITDAVLEHPGYTFLLISPDLALADDNYINRINALYDYALENDYVFYGVSVNEPQRVLEWMEGTGAEYPFLYGDATVLETVIRANPGVVLLHDGTIYWKKATISLPAEESLEQPLSQNEWGVIKKINPARTILYCILILFTPILLILLSEKTICSLLDRSKKRPLKKTESEEQAG